MFNVALLEEGRGCHAAALAMLNAVRDETERLSRTIPGARTTDPMWYRTIYNIAVVQENARSAAAAGFPAGPECQLPCDGGYKDAAQRPQTMIQSSARTIMAIERRRGSSIWMQYQWLVSFLRTTQSSSVVLLALMKAHESHV